MSANLITIFKKRKFLLPKFTFFKNYFRLFLRPVGSEPAIISLHLSSVSIAGSNSFGIL